MKLFSKACIVLALFVLVGCGGGGNGSEGSDGEASAKTVMHNGTITNVDTDAKKITVDVNGKKKEFSIEKSTSVLGKQYQKMPFDSLAVDREVGVEIEEGSKTPKKINIVN